MDNLTKKLSFALLAFTAAVCLFLSAFFAVRLSASAQTVKLDSAEYFDIDISDGTLNGLSPTGKEAVGDNFFTIELPGGLNVEYVGNGTGALSGCAKLTSIVLPEGVKTINSGAFYGCASLLTVTLPKSLTDIGTSAFMGCNRLIEVYNKSEMNVTEYFSVAKNIYHEEGGSKIQPATDTGFIFYENGNEVYLVDYTGEEVNLTLPSSYNDKSYSVFNETFKGNTALHSVTLPKYAKITDIGNGAFSGCTSLEEVNFNGNGLPAINDYAFSGCTSLKSVDIPSTVRTIGNSAFSGCTSLATVTFNKDEHLKDMGGGATATVKEYLLETIYGSAFEGCTSLKYIEIPDSVKNVQRKAFIGCTSLSTVYLPPEATFGDGVFESPVLIAPDAESYNKYSGGGLNIYPKLTYTVELNLVYGGSSHKDYRLYTANGIYIDCGYVLQEDGKTWANNGGLPVQEGYKTSVWYEEQSYTTEVNKSLLTDKLAAGREITLYAESIEKPVLTPNADLVYDKEVISFEEAVGWTDALGEKFEISVASYAPFIGTAEVPEVIKDAGAYSVSVTLKEQYGEWETPYVVSVNVGRATADITDFHWVSLSGEGYSELASTYGTEKPYIYLYNVGGNTVPYLDEDPSKTPVGQPKQVITSYLFYNGDPHTIILLEDEAYGFGGELEVNYISGNEATQSGVYTVKAEISADNNYEFAFTNGEDAILRGLSWSTVAGSGKVTLSKTWYVVAATVNGLVHRDGAPYSVPAVWTYKSDTFTAPTVIFGTDDLIKFGLRRKDLNANEYVDVCGNMSYDDFDNVINSSIPVGDYELTFNVEPHSPYAGFNQTFNFTVMNAVYENAEGGELGDIIEIAGTNEVRYKPGAQFAEVTGWDKLDGREKIHALPQGRNYWANSDYTKYYSGFEISYYVVSRTGDSGGYFTADDYAGNTDKKPRITPDSVGVYTVYYTVSAPGYAPLTGRSYTLFIYEQLNLADVQKAIDDMTVVYNGEARKPNLDNDIYRAVYLDDEANSEVRSAMAALGIEETVSYVNAGEYPVAIVIRDSHFVESTGKYLYRWSDWEENPSRMFVEVKLTVDKAENNTFTPLTLSGWEWNAYDPAKNPVSWSTEWVKDISAFTFELVSEKDGKTYAYGDFGKADSGFYKLKATCPEGENYKKGEAEILVVISPAEIKWQSAPYIESWKYGDFEKMFALPAPVLTANAGALQNEIVRGAYFLREGDGTKYDSISALINASGDERGELPAGRYSLVYSYAEQGNYSKFDYTVSFQVLKADNYWDIAPVVSGWAYGDKSIDYLTYKPDYVPHYGDAKKVVIQYRTLDEEGNAVSGWENRLADLGLDDYGKLTVGNYEVKATMSGSENYEDMEFSMPFKVSKAQNSWDAIPNVISWNEGRINSIDDVLTVAAANGTVLITISDSNGNAIIEDELPENVNASKLKSLGAGSYVLKAYVAGSDRFDELVAYVDFAIFEDNVSQTAIIALTIVFAVIAIALAVVGVVLLIRRDKKIEEEFRKMIKAELNRR